MAKYLFVLVLFSVFSYAAEPSSCRICKGAIESLRSTLQSNTTLELVRYALNLYCIPTYSKTFCELAWNNLAIVEYKGLINIIDPVPICTALSFCNSSEIVYDKRSDYIKRVLRDMPPTSRPYTKITNNAFRFLVFTDAHIDYDYEEGRTAQCNEPVCCRKQNPIAQKEKDRAGPYGYVGRCNLPLHTFAHFVKTAVEVIKPDAFFWLGDTPSNAVWNQTKDHHLDSLIEVSHMIQREGGSKYNEVGKVYPILGNHEGLPCNAFDFETHTHDWIVNISAKAWKPWLDEAAYSEYLRYGSYSQLHPGTKLRIVGINDLVHASINSYLWRNATDPWGVLSWLNKTLAKSENNGESVLILTHMPMENRQVFNEWASRYAALMERYKNTVKGQFFAHNHEDSFQLLRSYSNPHEYATFGFINPTIGTLNKKIPSFRVYYVDKDTYEVIDHETYRLNIEEANKGAEPKWTRAYKFTEYYGYPDASLKSYTDLGNRLGKDRELTEKYVRMRETEVEGWEKILNKLNKLHYLKCKVVSRTFEDLVNCTGIEYYGFFKYAQYYFLNHLIMRDWYYLKN